MRFQNGYNKAAIELRVVQFWSEIILVISNRTRTRDCHNLSDCGRLLESYELFGN